MTVRFVLKSNIPKELFHVEAFRVAQEEAFDDLAEEAKRLYEGTVSTWNDPPVFIIRKNKDGRSISTRGKAGEIYGYIDNGTRVRHAVMSPDFLAKTRPGVIFSGPGRGGVVFVSRKINLPGIKARGFSEIIQANINRRFPIRYRQVFDRLIHG